ncbi:hypothetical protein V6N11_048220 [Hibiscus sabdariffa]|uniref:Uncharacterized protein n=1 Tax=Hibiscus sabdariffa TaxID=183260 RepID=A0ABR2PUI6_9ROSI
MRIGPASIEGWLSDLLGGRLLGLSGIKPGWVNNEGLSNERLLPPFVTNASRRHSGGYSGQLRPSAESSASPLSLPPFRITERSPDDHENGPKPPRLFSPSPPLPVVVSVVYGYRTKRLDHLFPFLRLASPGMAPNAAKMPLTFRLRRRRRCSGDLLRPPLQPNGSNQSPLSRFGVGFTKRSPDAPNQG